MTKTWQRIPDWVKLAVIVVTALVTLTAWAVRLEGRVSVQESRVESQVLRLDGRVDGIKEQIGDLKQEVREGRAETRAQLDKIERLVRFQAGAPPGR